MISLINEDVNVKYKAEFSVMLCSNKPSLLLYVGLCHTGIKHNFVSGYIQRNGIQALLNLILRLKLCIYININAGTWLLSQLVEMQLVFASWM